jgi:predicted ATPase
MAVNRSHVALPWFLSNLARAHAELGHFDDAWRCIDEALTEIGTTKEKWHEAEVNRIAGEVALLSAEPDAAKAEAYLEHALAVARAQQAQSWPVWHVQQPLCKHTDLRMYAYANLLEAATLPSTLNRCLAWQMPTHISSVRRWRNSAQVGLADTFVELDPLVVGDTKPKFKGGCGE